MQPAPNFLPNEHTFETPNALFLHTGALIENNEITKIKLKVG